MAIEKDFGRPDTSKNYPQPTYFWYELSMLIYSLFNHLVGIQRLNFKRPDRKVLWVAVNLIIWLQLYDWQLYEVEEDNNSICPGDLLSAGVSYS